MEAEEFRDVPVFDNGAKRDGEETLSGTDGVEEGRREGGCSEGVEDGPDKVEIAGVDEGVKSGFKAHVGDEEGEAGESEGEVGGALGEEGGGEEVRPFVESGGVMRVVL